MKRYYCYDLYSVGFMDIDTENKEAELRSYHLNGQQVKFYISYDEAMLCLADESFEWHEVQGE